MRKIVLGLIMGLLMSVFMASAPAANAAPVAASAPAVVVSAIEGVGGNTVCNSRGSDTRSYFPAYYSNGNHTDLYVGRCASNVVGFAIPQGWYCTSPWGYRYNGGWFQVYYPFKSSGNYLVLDCRHA